MKTERTDRHVANALAVHAQAGDMSSLAALLILARPLARSIGARFGCSLLPEEDAASICIESFVRSLKKYDSQRSDILLFWSYQGRRAVIDYLRANIRGGRGNSRFLTRFLVELTEASEQAGTKFVNVEDFARRHEISVGRARTIALMAQAAQGASGMGTTQEWEIPAPGPTPRDAAELTTATENALDQFALLPKQQRAMLTDYYGLAGRERLTLSEIGQARGLSSERVRQIMVEALALIRTRTRAEDRGLPHILCGAA